MDGSSIRLKRFKGILWKFCYVLYRYGLKFYFWLYLFLKVIVFMIVLVFWVVMCVINSFLIIGWLDNNGFCGLIWKDDLGLFDFCFYKFKFGLRSIRNVFELVVGV